MVRYGNNLILLLALSIISPDAIQSRPHKRSNRPHIVTVNKIVRNPRVRPKSPATHRFLRDLPGPLGEIEELEKIALKDLAHLTGINLKNPPFVGQSRGTKSPGHPINVRTRVGSQSDARRYFHFAGLTYCLKELLQKSDSNGYIMNMGGTVKIRKVIEHSGLETQAVIASDHRRREILVGFRGTNNRENWKSNLNFSQSKLYNRNDPTTDGIMVHSGFLDISSSMEAHYIAEVQKIYSLNPSYRIVLIGHSLGGAVAQLSALKIKTAIPQLSWSQMKVVTYGQPRVGNIEFANYFNSLPITMTRVVNSNDLIPHVPPLFAGYVHTLTEMYVQGNLTTICSNKDFEDLSCSRANMYNLNSKVHSIAWEIMMSEESCFAKGENKLDLISKEVLGIKPPGALSPQRRS